ncbi:small nuclear ribonucleoprotein [Candidatus Woesearchaeota archaeon]|nr:small nuclear ribonucleoprotein [Nanoarchaeota archaeon]MCB9370386.1 small nuclear ribonucleoprotein [Candidatus Woesearchaeota archaeon]USN44906.1 MAG: small nuclear ribonucleoprotein [Candidatus Woesearchaeota archaeon]
MNQGRPFDVLSDARGKDVTLQLKNGTVITGKLLSFDIHLNLVLEEAKEYKTGIETGEEIGTTIVRGDTIVLVKGL